MLLVANALFPIITIKIIYKGLTQGLMKRIFLGYTITSKAYRNRIYDRRTLSVEESINVFFKNVTISC